jgi:predicted transcriptional regulator of viral defense system
MKESEVLRYIIENLEYIFPGMSLVGVQELLLERYRVDLHLIEGESSDVFIEVFTGRITKRRASRVLNYYSILANLDPPLKKFRFIVLGEDITRKVESILDSFGVEVRLFRDISIDEQKVRKHLFHKRLENVLTPIESELLSHIKISECSLVDVKEIQKILDIKAGYASKLLERLNQKGYLERILRGKYLYIPLEYGYEDRYPPMNSLVVGSVLMEPYYYGYHTANNYHGYTLQFSPMSYICTVKPRRNFRWRNFTYKFVTLVDDKFFGFTKVKTDGCEINVAEPEKAVLDTLDKPTYCGGVSQAAYVVSAAFHTGLDMDKLLSYGIRMKKLSILQRLGYLVELLSERGFINIRGDFLNYITSLIPEDVSYTYLGPVTIHGKQGPVEDRWKIIMNVNEVTVLSELEVK